MASASINADEYFSARAPRYAAALRACPQARSLDLIPYLAALSWAGWTGKEPHSACDAFGGTGLLAKRLRNAGLRFVIADCCLGMLCEADDAVQVLIKSDFEDLPTTPLGPPFSLVLCHGGLHHVVELDSVGGIDHVASRERQGRIVARLATMVKPGGMLVLADVPETAPAEQEGGLLNTPIDSLLLEQVYGVPAVARLDSLLAGAFSDRMPLGPLSKRIQDNLVCPKDFAIPRFFFDEYVRKSTPLGHVACYPDFDRLAMNAERAGLVPSGRINFLGPWLFRSDSEAGWFFKEKFSVYLAGEPGAHAEHERCMLETVSKYLGTREVSGTFCVNWGVTYALFVRPL